MSEARDDILGRLRRRLGRDVLDPERAGELEAELLRHERRLIPARADVSGEDCVRLFEEMVEVSLASVERTDANATLPRTVAAYLDARQLPCELVIPPENGWSDLDWERAGIRVQARHVRSGDVAALAPAFCGVAETGTLVFLSGARHQTLSSFLPDHHLAVLSKRDLVGSYEDAWDRIRARGEDMPRTVNWVTGPSRSADIELTMLMGAHGPLSLHVIIIENR